MSLELIQQQAVKTYNENIAYFKEYHPKLYENLVIFETALNENHIQAKFDLQYKENYFEIIGLEQNIPFYGQNSVELSKKMVNDAPLFDATKNSFKTYYEHQYNDEIAQIALESDMLVKYTLSNAPIVHYVNKNLPDEQILNDIHKFIIFGVGLGLHITHIHEQINAKMYCIVEPNLEIFRLSLFVTNYADLAKKSKLFLSVAQNEVAFREIFNKFYAESFVLNHYLKFFQFGQGHDLYIKTIQNSLVSQPHYLYSYDRTFLSLLRTHSYISQDYPTLNVKDNHKLKLFEKPVLYLAAGPSLQRNIEFVKENQEKFIIVAIYATLPILEKHKIKPDIVTQYDEQDKQVLNTIDKINDISFFDDCVFIFSSHVNAKLMSSFPKKNIFIFQAMFELKKEFGMLTSPSIGELTYGILLKLGVKNLYILGLDLAMDAETNQTHIDGHSGSNVFNQLKDLDNSDDTQYSYRKNTILVKGNFSHEVKSIPVFKTNIDSFGVFSKQFKSQNCNVYNLSNGAYLEGAEPLEIKNISLDSFDNKNSKFQEKICSSLETISEVNYNKNDLESIQLKISGAKKVKKDLANFFKVKNHKSVDEYKNKLIIMLSDILFNKYNCEDLQQILINYSSHVIHNIFHLYSLKHNQNTKKSFYEINKILNIQLNKIVDTYVIAISYSQKENILTKKLHKYIKEYHIKDTIYSEPQFKELVETSLKTEQDDIGKNAIGFFAIKENLSHKAFVEYIKNLLELSSDVKLKLFYFYEYQKVLAQQVFKQNLKQIEFIIPHNTKKIAQNIELWFETSEKTPSLKKVDDILLNNFKNLFSCMFTKEHIPDNDKQISSIETTSSLKKMVKENYYFPNSDYYHFANSLKEEVDTEKLLNLYKKEHIGFFAFEENLTKEFIQNILNIYNKFPQLKFVAFYFNKKQKQVFEKQFKNLLARFEFITPRNIYDIAENIEIWVQANIKNESLLHSRVFQLFSKMSNLFTIPLYEMLSIKNTGYYLNDLILDFYNIKLLKYINSINLCSNVHEEYNKNCIGFLANNANLNDTNFLKMLDELAIEYPTATFKGFYTNKNDLPKTSAINFSPVLIKDNLLTDISCLVLNFDSNLDRRIYPLLSLSDISVFIFKDKQSTRKLSEHSNPNIVKIYKEYREVFQVNLSEIETFENHIQLGNYIIYKHASDLKTFEKKFSLNLTIKELLFMHTGNALTNKKFNQSHNTVRKKLTQINKVP